MPAVTAKPTDRGAPVRSPEYRVFRSSVYVTQNDNSAYETH